MVYWQAFALLFGGALCVLAVLTGIIMRLNTQLYQQNRTYLQTCLNLERKLKRASKEVATADPK